MKLRLLKKNVFNSGTPKMSKCSCFVALAPPRVVISLSLHSISESSFRNQFVYPCLLVFEPYGHIFRKVLPEILTGHQSSYSSAFGIYCPQTRVTNNTNH